MKNPIKLRKPEATRVTSFVLNRSTPHGYKKYIKIVYTLLIFNSYANVKQQMSYKIGSSLVKGLYITNHNYWKQSRCTKIYNNHLPIHQTFLRYLLLKYNLITATQKAVTILNEKHHYLLLHTWLKIFPFISILQKEYQSGSFRTKAHHIPLTKRK